MTPQSVPEPPAIPGAVAAGKIQAGYLELVCLDLHPLIPVNWSLRRFTLSGMPGTVYRIEATTDLRQWMVVGECLTDWFGKALVVSVDVADPNTPEALIPDAIWMGYRPSPLVGIPDLGPSAFYRIVR